MFLRRSYAIAVAALALVGCATSSFADNYNQYPGGYYNSQNYDWLGYNADVDNNSSRYIHPARNVTCDRVRDICYDRYGLSYHATARYLGEREANKAYKHYGNQVFLFSPKRGVVCDRRTQICSGANWSPYGNVQRPRVQLEKGNFGAIGSTRNLASQQNRYWPSDACSLQGCANR